MEVLKESAIILVRIITIFPLFLLITQYMGKRSIGEMPIFDFLIIMTLANVVGADIADPEVDHAYTYLAIIVIPLVQRLTAYLSITNRKIGKKITFEPTLVIQDGKILAGNLKKIRYSIDNVLQMLRQKNIFDISDVKIAIIEANGQISVLKKENKLGVTIEDIDAKKKSKSLSYPLIMEGKIYEDILNYLGLNRQWLMAELHRRQVAQLNRVFFASINDDRELHVSLKTEQQQMPPIYN
ncbi:hypothetical protein JCM9140_2894 [Halalkalibacter wakoensis JCM 9140]|uniref:YetF C-terminal domain-containing protein n=1 Tax=Halalkalibacter wakoensis JCM 9140 TaxID=1236970 RepID=W4Q5Z2_9BACI|nr:DUF421 domain-containing protein [Halalkalibacter wakoensis]GAE26794.1 hypothetical protein JCM9140_2894 [Halalkalibacter wakoensis JCM 9140]